MPAIAPGATLPRTPLGEVAMDYEDRQALIALRVLPPHIVGERASEYLFWDVAKAMGLASVERGADGKFPRMTREHLGRRVYSCQIYGQEYPVDYFEALDLVMSAFDIDSHVEAAQIIDRVLLRAHEKRVADFVFSTGAWTDGATDYHEAGPPINNDPTADVDDLVAQINREAIQNCGARYDTAVMSRKTYANLGLNDQVKARVNIPQITANLFAMLQKGQIVPELTNAYEQYFQVDEVIVADAQFADQPRNEAGGDPGFQSIWSEDFLLFMRRVPSQRGLKGSAVAGRTFVWGPASGPGGEPFINPPYTEGNILDVIQGYHALDAQVFNPRCGKLFTGIDA